MTSHTSEGETDDLRGQAEHHLVSDTPVLVEVDSLSSDDISRVNSLSGDVDHDGDQGVLLDVEGTRVQRDRVSKCLDALCEKIVVHHLSEDE